MKERNYALLYHPNLSISKVTPVLTLAGLLDFVNTLVASKTPDEYNDGEKNNVARLVRLNWMVDHIRYHPIMKPLVLCYRDSKLETITGDTRLQAIEVENRYSHTNAILSVPTDHLDEFPDWIYVQDQQHLADLLKMDVNDLIFFKHFKNWYDEELEWIEFALPESEDHMHVEQERLDMFCHYLEQYPDTVFTREWLQQTIDWSDYAVN